MKLVKFVMVLVFILNITAAFAEGESNDANCAQINDSQVGEQVEGSTPAPASDVTAAGT